MSGDADVELLQRILRETGVDQAVPGPSMAGYVEDLAEAAAEAVSRRWPGLSWLSPFLEALGPPAAFTVLALLVVALVMVVVAQLARRRRAPAPGVAPVERVPERRFTRDRDAWRRELEAQLARGNLADALQALWWWFACSASATDVEPSWTSREVLARSGRADLMPLAHRLDRLLYGPSRPDVAALRAFVAVAEAGLS